MAFFFFIYLVVLGKQKSKGKGRNTWQAPVLASVSQSPEGVGEEVGCASRLCERRAHWDSQTLECLEAD